MCVLLIFVNTFTLCNTSSSQGTFVSVVVRYGDVRLLDVVRIGHTSEEYWTLNARVF